MAIAIRLVAGRKERAKAATLLPRRLVKSLAIIACHIGPDMTPAHQQIPAAQESKPNRPSKSKKLRCGGRIRTCDFPAYGAGLLPLHHAAILFSILPNIHVLQHGNSSIKPQDSQMSCQNGFHFYDATQEELDDQSILLIRNTHKPALSAHLGTTYL